MFTSLSRSARLGNAFIFLTLASLAATSNAHAEDVKSFDLTIQNHVFTPDTLTIPANEKVTLNIKNADTTAEEFESDDLHREKVVSAGDTLKLNVGPLKPGEYKFFGDYHQKTAHGTIIAK